jgi:hypothetical protein
MSVVVVGLGFLAAAGLTALMGVWGPRSERGRRILRGTYTNPYQPLVWRAWVGTIPPMVLAFVAMAAIALLPRGLAPWMVIGAIDLESLAIVLSYRVPQPFLPAFLREEISTGVTALARPTRTDWVILGLYVPLAIVGNIAWLLLVVVNHGGS